MCLQEPMVVREILLGIHGGCLVFIYSTCIHINCQFNSPTEWTPNLDSLFINGCPRSCRHLLKYLDICWIPWDSNFGDSSAHSTFHGIPMGSRNSSVSKMLLLNFNQVVDDHGSPSSELANSGHGRFDRLSAQVWNRKKWCLFSSKEHRILVKISFWRFLNLESPMLRIMGLENLRPFQKFLGKLLETYGN